MNTLWMRGMSLDLVTATFRGGMYHDNTNAYIVCLYGPRDPVLTPAGWTGWIDPVTGQRVDFHLGLDAWTAYYWTTGGWWSAEGEPLLALGYGTVSQRVTDLDGMGNMVEVTYQTADGPVRVQYFHMMLPCQYALGASVVPGNVLGYVGATGKADGAHLHVAFYLNDYSIDPLVFFSAAQPLGYVPPAPVVPVLWVPSARVVYQDTGPAYWQHNFEVRMLRKQSGANQQTGQPWYDVATGETVWPFYVEDWES